MLCKPWEQEWLLHCLLVVGIFLLTSFQDSLLLKQSVSCQSVVIAGAGYLDCFLIFTNESSYEARWIPILQNPDHFVRLLSPLVWELEEKLSQLSPPCDLWAEKSQSKAPYCFACYLLSALQQEMFFLSLCLSQCQSIVGFTNRKWKWQLNLSKPFEHLLEPNIGTFSTPLKMTFVVLLSPAASSCS